MPAAVPARVTWNCRGPYRRRPMVAARRDSALEPHVVTSSSPSPLTRHDDLVRAQRARVPLAPGDAVRVGVTGTGDGLLVLTWSAAQLARERAAGVRMLRRLGV